MKTKFLAVALFAITFAGFTGLAQETNQPVRPIPLDPRAMQMQRAILKDRDIHQVEALLKQGVDINAPIGCGTYSPLDGAVATQDLEMLKFLLAHGAKPQGRELPDAAFYQNPQTAMNFVKVLLSAGVDPNATDRIIGSALGCAAYQTNRDLVVLLLAQPHIKIDITNEDGCTALMTAAGRGAVDIEDLLIKAGADQRLKGWEGQTATDMDERNIATRKAVRPYVYVSGGVARTGWYHWVQGMTVLDAINAAGGFTNFVSGPVWITHVDGTAEWWVYPPSTRDATNTPTVLSQNDDVYVRIY